MADIRGSGMKNRIKKFRLTGLVYLMLVIAVAAAACSKPTKEKAVDNVNINKNNIGPTVTLTLQPTPTKEPEATTQPTPAGQPEATVMPTLTKGPEATAQPTPTKEPVPTSESDPYIDFIPSDKAVHSMTAFTQGNYLFYKSGKLTKTKIVSKNLTTSKTTDIVEFKDSVLSSAEFYLKGSEIYYQEEKNIYRVGVDGKNKTKLYTGTAVIMGFLEDDIFLLDKASKKIIRINKDCEVKSLGALHSINPLEAVMTEDGIYYISKSSDNTLNGNDPTDRLYYMNFDGKNKAEVYSGLDVFDLKTTGNEIFFMSINKERDVMQINKVEDKKASAVISLNKKDLEAAGCNWFEENTFTLLAVNNDRVYYGIDFNNTKEMNIYSAGIDGKDFGLYLNAYDIKGIYKAAYFSRGDIEEGYLKIVFDCDENPAEIYLINLQDKSAVKFEGAYYMPGSIDVEGDYVYYCKSAEYNSGEEVLSEAYDYGYSKISELK